MALSNWSSIGYNPKGKECIAEFEWENKDEDPKLTTKHYCNMYKNWLKIGSQEDKELLITMESGYISYAGIGIDAARGKKDPRRCFFIIQQRVTTVPYDWNVKNWKKQPGRSHNEFMAGVGTYAFTDSGREVGITKDCKKEFIAFLKNYGITERLIHIGKDKKLKNRETGKPLFPDNKDFIKWFNKIKASKNKKYNQGTLYFAKHGIMGNPLLALGKKKKHASTKTTKPKSKHP